MSDRRRPSPCQILLVPYRFPVERKPLAVHQRGPGTGHLTHARPHTNNEPYKTTPSQRRPMNTRGIFSPRWKQQKTTTNPPYQNKNLGRQSPNWTPQQSSSMAQPDFHDTPTSPLRAPGNNINANTMRPGDGTLLQTRAPGGRYHELIP